MLPKVYSAERKLQAVQDYLAGKGKRISDYSDDDILAVELWANNLPRKVLGYKTPDEAFGAEMDTIFVIPSNQIEFYEVYKMVTLFNCFSFNDEWYLVEMALTIPPQEIEFNKIVVPEEGVKERDWQTVLAEQFLNNDGTERICDLYETPDNGVSDSRVAFFIYKSNSHILRTPYGQFDLSDAEEVPDRLKDIIEVDDDYM